MIRLYYAIAKLYLNADDTTHITLDDEEQEHQVQDDY